MQNGLIPHLRVSLASTKPLNAKRTYSHLHRIRVYLGIRLRVLDDVAKDARQIGPDAPQLLEGVQAQPYPTSEGVSVSSKTRADSGHHHTYCQTFRESIDLLLSSGIGESWGCELRDALRDQLAT